MVNVRPKRVQQIAILYSVHKKPFRIRPFINVKKVPVAKCFRPFLELSKAANGICQNISVEIQNLIYTKCIQWL